VLKDYLDGSLAVFKGADDYAVAIDLDPGPPTRCAAAIGIHPRP